MKNVKKIILCLFIAISLFSLTSCNKTTLEAPLNISIDEENNLVWDDVEGAKSYTIYFQNVDTNITTSDTSRKNSYDLSQLEVGNYQIIIKSVSGDKSTKDSKDSEVIIYQKYPETGCIYKLINNNTEYAISKVGSAKGTFVIEDYYRGKAVTEIQDKAFKGNSKVENITLGENIIIIGESAFWNCSKLEKLYIPNSVISIGKSAFQSCRVLKDINIPNSLKTIPEYCFAYCRSIESILIPDSVEEILESAFVNCSGLLSIDIPDSVELIGPSCFFGCESLEEAKIGANVEYINESAFSTCKKLKTVTFKEGSKIKEIGNVAFKECSILESIFLPNGLTYIGESCFFNDTLLNDLAIPETVTSVGAYAFQGTKLFNDQLNDNEDLIYADTWLIYVSDSAKENLTEINTSTIKNTIVGIADNVFQGSTKLKIVILPQTIRYIGNSCFNTCSQLWKFKTLDNSIKIIGDYCFTMCALTNVSLGYGLERIGNFAFWGNANLDNNELTPYDWIPETVTSIGRGAFNNTMMATKASSGSGIIYAGNWAVGLALNLTTVDLKFDSDHVAGIADYAFMYAGLPELAEIMSIRTVTGLTNVKYIGVGAFYGNVQLNSVSLNRNLEEIREATFYNTGLVKATLPRSLKSIGDYAFSNSQLTSVDLTTTKVESIGKSAFYGIGGMIELKLNDDLKTIGDYAFCGCTNLKEVVIPESVTSIGENAFCGCETLETLSFSKNVSVLETAVFAHCPKLKTVTGFSGVTKIDAEAFYECNSLESIDLSDNLVSIGDAAFMNNTNLDNLYLSKNLKSVGVYAFQGCKTLKTVTLSSSIKTLQQHAFYECDNLTIYTSYETRPQDWHARFNSSNRTIFWNTELDDNNNVVYVNINDDDFLFRNTSTPINSPYSKDKVFKNFIDTDNKEYSMDDLKTITGTIKLKGIYE